MTWKERFEFLNRKREVVAPFLRADTALNYEMMFSHVISKMGEALEPIPDAALMELDRSLEKSIAEEMLEHDEAAIRAQLREQYGFASLTREPMKVLRRIERARKINDDEEARIVDDFLAGSYQGGEMDERRRKRLSEIARDYYERRRQS